MIDKAYIRKAFDRYVADYDAGDPKIRLKIDHTYRVAGLCARIAEEVPGTEPDLAWVMGMLHDIGRFEQVRRYHTFIDARSVQHAAFGADLLFREGLLEQLAPGLSEEQRHLLEVSIRNHSAYRLPAELTEIERLYCQLLRDADKIDIFRVIWETPLEDIYNVSREALENATVSEEVKDCFRSRTSVLRELKKTPIDYLVAHICMSFELVLPVSREIAGEQDYLGRLLAFRSRNPETEDWFAYMRANYR